MKRDLYTSLFAVYGLVMTLEGLVMQIILQCENEFAMVSAGKAF